MENLVEIVKLVAEVGFPIVCSGIFLIIAVKMINKNQKWLEEFISSSIKPSHPTSEDSVALDVINDKIYQELRGLLNALGSDRAYVFLYHNGGVSTSGLFFQKMSCICEVVSSGILPLISSSQNLHRSSYSYLCNQLKSQGKSSVPNVDDLRKEDSFFYQEMISRHSKSSYFRSLKDNEGHVIGFIGIDYCSDCKIDEDRIHKLLKTVSLKVSSLVDIRDEVK